MSFQCRLNMSLFQLKKIKFWECRRADLDTCGPDHGGQPLRDAKHTRILLSFSSQGCNYDYLRAAAEAKKSTTMKYACPKQTISPFASSRSRSSIFAHIQPDEWNPIHSTLIFMTMRETGLESVLQIIQIPAKKMRKKNFR